MVKSEARAMFLCQVLGNGNLNGWTDLTAKKQRDFIAKHHDAFDEELGESFRRSSCTPS